MERIYGGFHGGRVGAALLLLRLIVGLAFIFHGWPKIRNVAGFAGALKLPVWLAAVAAYTEVIGGILLILGLLTVVAAALIGIEMLVALFMVHFPVHHPFVNPTGQSFETPAFYLFTMLAFLLAGPGAYSVDAVMSRSQVAGEATGAVGRQRGVA
jgi:putative oxidoreductase